MDDTAQIIVVDNGSSVTRAGFAGDDGPRAVFPSIVGRLRHKHGIFGRRSNERCYVGEEANINREMLTIKRPIEHRIITNWDDIEELWLHTFYNELGVAPEEHPVLLTEAPLNPKANREKMVQFLFETCKTPAAYLAAQPALSLYDCGRATGLVLDAGDGVIHSVPIYEGYIVRRATLHAPFAGRDLTDYLMRRLNQKGCSLTTVADRDNIARDIKERLCYVALNYDQEMQTVSSSSSLERKHELPSGHVVTIDKERFQTPEAMFQPNLMKMESVGIHDIMNFSILKLDADVRKDFYSNIILSGGSTMFPGMSDRLKKEMTTLAGPDYEVEIVAPEGRSTTSVWSGGSKLASCVSFRENMITLEEYYERGPHVVHMCF